MGMSLYERDHVRALARRLYLNLRKKGLSHELAITAVIDFVITACEI